MPSYGKVNGDYFASVFARDEPGGPMWALNLMKYREVAEYADGRASKLTGLEADDAYAPHEHLAAVGSRLIFVAPVVHHLRGDSWLWDRVAIAHYRDRMAMVEMSSNEDFQKDEQHKEAGMDFTIVMATFPAEGDPIPPQESGVAADQLMLVQVVGDSTATDLADGVAATRVGRFRVEAAMLGDDRTFAEARFDVISHATAERLSSQDYVEDDSGYALIVDPATDEIARSLTEPTRVLPA